MSNKPEHEVHTEPPRESEPQPSIIQPIIDELKGTSHPPQPAELDQDAGGGYNPDGTYPQT